MPARWTWRLGLCVCGGVLSAGCKERPTPPPPVAVTAGDSVSLGEACRDPKLKWASTKPRKHTTIEGARLRLEAEKGNHLIKKEAFDTGRVIALLIVDSGSVDFEGVTVTGLDSICIFVKGKYPEGNDPGMLRSTFVRRRTGFPLEEVGTDVRVGTPHEQSEVDWVVNYTPMQRAGMLPFPPLASQDRIRKQTQGACGGGCCAPKKPF